MPVHSCFLPGPTLARALTACLALLGLSCAAGPAKAEPGIAAGGAPGAAPGHEALGAAERYSGERGLGAVSRRDLLIRPATPDHDDGYLYRLPYGDGVSYAILQGYGAPLSHRGAEQFTLDFRMSEGTPVHSAREGQVVLVEDSFSESCWAEGCGRYANFVVILHDDGTTGEYFHLQQGSALVEPGDYIERGEPIARSGNTGYSNAPHLHFGVYRAAADGTAQSIPIRFETRRGAVDPRAGARYLNAVEARFRRE